MRGLELIFFFLLRIQIEKNKKLGGGVAGVSD